MKDVITVVCKEPKKVVTEKLRNHLSYSTLQSAKRIAHGGHGSGRQATAANEIRRPPLPTKFVGSIGIQSAFNADPMLRLQCQSSSIKTTGGRFLGSSVTFLPTFDCTSIAATPVACSPRDLHANDTLLQMNIASPDNAHRQFINAEESDCMGC